MPDGKMIHIFGPCAAESEEQTLRIAQRLLGVSCASLLIFRAGIWKPRTSPDTFQGVGDIGLTWLQRVRHECHLPVATEVSTPEQVQKALDAGMDYLWIGARTSANPISVQTLANAIKEHPRKPQGLCVKNPVNEDTDLWIGNIRRFIATTRLPVYAIHRGCNHQPCWAMAYHLRQELPDIPILLDPSHMSGDADQVAQLCTEAKGLDYNGLMIEVHDHPAEALSDAKQQITPEALETMLQALQTIRPSGHQTLSWLRRIMDEIDNELWNIIAKRMDISKQIGAYKKSQNMEVLQPTRFAQILTNRLEWAKQHDISPEAVRQIMDAIHSESVRVQNT